MIILAATRADFAHFGRKSMYMYMCVEHIHEAYDMEFDVVIVGFYMVMCSDQCVLAFGFGNFSLLCEMFVGC
jgi:hypothetical protein